MVDAAGRGCGLTKKSCQVVNEKDGSVVSRRSQTKLLSGRTAENGLRFNHPSAVFGVAWHPMQVAPSNAYSCIWCSEILDTTSWQSDRCCLALCQLFHVSKPMPMDFLLLIIVGDIYFSFSVLLDYKDLLYSTLYPIALGANLCEFSWILNWSETQGFHNIDMPKPWHLIALTLRAEIICQLFFHWAMEVGDHNDKLFSYLFSLCLQNLPWDHTSSINFSLSISWHVVWFLLWISRYFLPTAMSTSGQKGWSSACLLGSSQRVAVWTKDFPRDTWTNEMTLSIQDIPHKSGSVRLRLTFAYIRWLYIWTDLNAYWMPIVCPGALLIPLWVQDDGTAASGHATDAPGLWQAAQRQNVVMWLDGSLVGKNWYSKFKIPLMSINEIHSTSHQLSSLLK